MILVTGDTHGDIDFNKLLADNLKHLTAEDYVIVCGDCGVLFFPREQEKMIKMYSSLPFTVLFVDGNHENFDLLESYPVEEWHGGKIHRISDKLIHLMRGQVFELEGHTFFTFGGAFSIDKAWRKPGISWWPQEMPSDEEVEEGFKNLEKYHNQVDYVLTHDCPITIGRLLSIYTYKAENGNVILAKSNEVLEQILNRIEFKHWYFGHYHVDKKLSRQFTCLYQDMIQIA